MPLRNYEGSSWNPNELAQSDVFKALGIISSGQGKYPAGGLWTVSGKEYVKIDPNATDDTAVTYGVNLSSIDARTESQLATIGHRGTFTLEKVFVPKYASFTGDGTTTVFSLGEPPKQGTVSVAVDGTLQLENTDYTVDYTTGDITFSTAPASNANIEIWYGRALIEDKHKQFNGDGTTTVFSVGESIEYDFVEVFVDGEQQTKGTDYTVDYTTGDITFTTAPASGAAIDVYYKHVVYESVVRKAEDNEIYLIQMDTTVHTS